jgi:hypothetical protein
LNNKLCKRVCKSGPHRLSLHTRRRCACRTNLNLFLKGDAMTAPLDTLVPAAILAAAALVAGCEATVEKPQSPVAATDGNPYPAGAETPMLWDSAKWKQYSANTSAAK